MLAIFGDNSLSTISHLNVRSDSDLDFQLLNENSLSKVNLSSDENNENLMDSSISKIITGKWSEEEVRCSLI